MGPLRAGEWVSLIDHKGKRKSIQLTEGDVYHTTKGMLHHDDLIGRPEGIVVTTLGGQGFTVFRPLMNEYLVSMPRKAAIIYPKDIAQILIFADIFPGARVLEAGVGSGALTCGLLRAVGEQGSVTSYERRPEFAAQARANVEQFFGATPPQWTLTTGDLNDAVRDEIVDRVILDMLAPWDCISTAARVLEPGGMLCCYVTTTTQMGRVADVLRAHGEFTEPSITETVIRDWHAEGLAIRPTHSASAHTGFLIFARRMAPGYDPLPRKRRPAPGAYGPDYTGPMPRTIPAEFIDYSNERAESERWRG